MGGNRCKEIAQHGLMITLNAHGCHASGRGMVSSLQLAACSLQLAEGLGPRGAPYDVSKGSVFILP